MHIPEETRYGPPHHGLVCLFVCCLWVVITGCGGPQKGSDDPKPTKPSNVTMVDATREYRDGNYAASYQSAAALTGKLRGSQADQAAYLAGMSAYRLGRDDDALKYLVGLTDHGDDALAGASAATVGLVFAKRAQHPRALDYYTSAVKRLKGNDLAHAYYHMAITEQKLGLYAQAKPHLVLAAGNATDPTLRAAAEERMKSSGFTVQFGAYSTQKNAEQRVGQVAGDTQRAGLGKPWVLATDSRGKRLYLVQAGRFGTYEAALAAVRKLGRNDVVVEKLSTP